MHPWNLGLQSGGFCEFLDKPLARPSPSVSGNT
jgi:hypothetical protein